MKTHVTCKVHGLYVVSIRVSPEVANEAVSAIDDTDLATLFQSELARK